MSLRARRPRWVGALVLATAVVAIYGLPGGSRTTPALTVVLVVDQMRADYLERFGPLFEGGFAR